VLCVAVVATFSLSWAVAVVASPQALACELNYDAGSGIGWQAAPAYVHDPVRITRGRGDESQHVVPGSVSSTLDNRTGAYNPRNPLSALFGKAGRNTPQRISLAGDVRATGEVASWKPKRTVDFDPAAGRGDAWTEVESTGVLRRLGQGDDVLQSALYREIMANNPTAYWPLEDGQSATEAASPVAGVEPMRAFNYSRFTIPGSGGVPEPVAGLPKFGTGSGIPGSGPVIDLSQGGVLQAPVPAGAGGGWRVEFTMIAPRDAPDTRIVLEWRVDNGDARWNQWQVQLTSGGFGASAFFGNSSTGVSYGSASTTFNAFDGLPHHWRIDAGPALDPTQVYASLNIDGQFVSQFLGQNGNDMVAPSGRVTQVIVNPLEYTNGDQSMPVIGHAAVWNVDPGSIVSGSASAAFGWPGETAADRFMRLCAEEGLTSTVIGTAADTQPMGAQRIAGFTDLLAEIERTDDGIVYEPRDSLGLAFRTGASLQNQTAVLALDYADLAPPLDPVIDDLATRNDVTATSSTTKAFARAVLETGRMSVLAPPNGVGRYKAPADVNPADDAQLPNLAGWYLHKGTADETRFPRITVDLTGAAPGLVTAVGAVDVGDLITIANMPADVATGLVSLIVQGYTETIGSHTRSITFNATPASVYNVAVVDGNARVPADGSTLGTGGLASGGTSFPLTSTAANGPWRDTASDPTVFPMDVRVGGERVTLSAISGTTSPQTATISARGVNGITRAWPAGTEVDMWNPAIVAL
jgi:hypothetical protein